MRKRALSSCLFAMAAGSWLFAFSGVARAEEAIVANCLGSLDIQIAVYPDKGTAIMYLGGNYFLDMTAKPIHFAGSTPDNVYELKAGHRPIHLNRDRKILYFREGSEGTFANVTIKEVQGSFMVRCKDYTKVGLRVWPESNQAFLDFGGNGIAKLSAKYVSYAGANQKKYMIEMKAPGPGPRSIQLNLGRKILLFSEGSQGTFCSVKLK